MVGAGLGLEGDVAEALALGVVDLKLEGLGLGAGEEEGGGAGGGVGRDGVPCEGMAGFWGGDGALVGGEINFHVKVRVTASYRVAFSFYPPNTNRVRDFC